MELIEAFIPTLGGVLLGFALVTMKEYVTHRTRSKKDRIYLCIQTTLLLDQLIERCADIAYGVGQRTYTKEEGSYVFDHASPTFSPSKLDVDWTTLDPNIVSRIFNLPRLIQLVDSEVKVTVDRCVPSYATDEITLVRSREYSFIGLEAASLAQHLRNVSGLKARNYNDRDPVDRMQRKQKSFREETSKVFKELSSIQ